MAIPCKDLLILLILLSRTPFNLSKFTWITWVFAVSVSICRVVHQDQIKLNWCRSKAFGKFIYILEKEWCLAAEKKHGLPPADHWRRLIVS